MKSAAWMVTESWFRPPTAIWPKRAAERHFEPVVVAKARWPIESVDEEADERPMPELRIKVWAETGAETVDEAVRCFRALRCLARNGQDHSTAISGYGPGRGVDVADAGN